MKPLETLRAAREALVSADRRVQAALLLSLLLLFASVYLLVWFGGRAGGASPVSSRVYEPMDAITRFRGERERVREVEIQQLNALIADASAGQKLRDAAREQLTRLVAWMEQETTVEGVLRAQGFYDPLVTVHQGSVNVLVRMKTLTPSDAAKILSLAVRETGQPSENVRILPTAGEGDSG